MAAKAIISYDGTANDQDALELARVLAEASVTLQLAYVRHAKESQREREQLEEHEADRLLQAGARALGDLDVERRVILSASTAEGLGWLAQEEGADILVFGSDYRTAAGHVAPQRSAQKLLEGGPAAIAICPASYRSEESFQFGRIGMLAAPDDDVTIATACDLGQVFGARVARDEPYVDLLVVGSRPEAPVGRVIISSHAQHQIENATSPVLVLPRGVRIPFGLPVQA
jgi:nucleotide-binding universal stress UspA family protein